VLPTHESASASYPLGPAAGVDGALSLRRSPQSSTGTCRVYERHATMYKVKPFHRATEFLNALLIVVPRRAVRQDDQEERKKRKAARKPTVLLGRQGTPFPQKKMAMQQQGIVVVVPLAGNGMASCSCTAPLSFSCAQLLRRGRPSDPRPSARCSSCHRRP